MNYTKIAQLAHVSVSTVSKAFSNSNEINTKTREEIFRIAREYGCFDKYYKEKFPRRVIAVICPEFLGDYYAEYVESIQKALERFNAIATLSSTGFDIKTENDLIEFYTAYAKVDGIILVSPQNQKISRYSIPVAVIGNSIDNCDCIDIDSYDAMLSAIELLKAKGHEKICFFGEPLTYTKEQNFLKAAKSLGINVPLEYVIHSSGRFSKGGHECAEKLLKLKNRPTAIIAAYDLMAIGAVNCLKRNHFKIPEDFSVIGMDDISEASHLDVPLTTITSHIPEAVSAAVDLIMNKIEHPTFDAVNHIKISSSLVERASVGVPKNS